MTGKQLGAGGGRDRRLGNWAVVLLAALAAIALLKTFRPVNSYATGHWLFNYSHGFIRRGLLGTLMSPILFRLPPANAQALIHVIGWASLGLFLALLVRIGLRAGSGVFGRAGRDGSGPPSIDGIAVPAMLLASPAAIWLGHTVGYFDLYLLALGLGGVWLLHAQRSPGWVGLVCVLGTLIHEMFLVMVLPGLFVAALVRSLDARDERPWLPVLVVGGVGVGMQTLFIVLGSAEPANLYALEHDVYATELVAAADNKLFYALSTPLDEVTAVMEETWPERMPTVVYDALGYLPLLVFILAIVFVRLRARGLSRASLGLVFAAVIGAVLCPLALHAVAWDGGRINSYMAWAAFFTWLAACRPLPPGSASIAWRPGPAWIVAAGLVVALGQSSNTTLMEKYEVAFYPQMFTRLPDEWEKFAARPAYRDLGAMQPVFENSDFESGDLRNWEAQGEGFANQPTWHDNAVTRIKSAAAVQGDWWVGTYENNPSPGVITGAAQGDRLGGTLRSRAFEVTHDLLAFKIGGGQDRQRLYVAFEVDGEEVARYTGLNLEHMRPAVLNTRPYRGRQMTIVIVDHSSREWGHINVDGFVWLLDDTHAEAVIARWKSKARSKSKSKSKVRRKG